MVQKYAFSAIPPKFLPKTFGRVEKCSYFCTVVSSQGLVTGLPDNVGAGV